MVYSSLSLSGGFLCVWLGLVLARQVEFGRGKPAGEKTGARLEREAEAGERLLQDAFGPQPRFSIFLGEFKGEVGGYAFVFETYSTFKAKPKLYLEDIFVKPEFRSKKVGLALFRRCVAEAERRGCIRLEWSVLDWNDLAQQFYFRLGAKHQKGWYPFSLSKDQFPPLLKLEVTT